MKRPFLVHFLAVMTDAYINIKASISMKENEWAYGGTSRNFADDIAKDLAKDLEAEMPGPRFPIQALRLLRAHEFKLKVIGLDENQEEILRKTFESDEYGNFNFKIPLDEERRKIKALLIYEVGKQPGMELILGTYIPLIIKNPKKLVICDFDKTLVETKYSTTKEVYQSLTKPLEYFPTLENSLTILKEKIEDGFHPFILSASPHFYEDAIRDWLYQHKIFTAGIFLKDYRKVFSLFEEALTPKDLKIQGMYKMNHLLDILLMVGIPDELVLMGDNFESDPIIYLGLAHLIKGEMEPRRLWSLMKKEKAFKMNRKQDGQILNKIYQLSNLIKAHKSQRGETQLGIYIRKKANEESLNIGGPFSTHLEKITLFNGNARLEEIPVQIE